MSKLPNGFPIGMTGGIEHDETGAGSGPVAVCWWLLLTSSGGSGQTPAAGIMGSDHWGDQTTRPNTTQHVKNTIPASTAAKDLGVPLERMRVLGEAQALSRSASQQAQTLGVASGMSTELIRGYEESLRNPGRFFPDAERDWLPAVPPFTNWNGRIQRNTQTSSRNYDDIDGFLACNPRNPKSKNPGLNQNSVRIPLNLVHDQSLPRSNQIQPLAPSLKQATHIPMTLKLRIRFVPHFRSWEIGFSFEWGVESVAPLTRLFAQ
ncbi:hypothetical protein I7I51_08319 [Histoplasma capsulatum]|uniref:Uncharacterized protein n=1 Tax=Ajellomyces capsulatus TaxID=5037 RepID=A0A8A1LYC2_AJECA|nr:hypothetical protein I7I51_08319 [Histoplasma capsulatum]